MTLAHKVFAHKVFAHKVFVGKALIVPLFAIAASAVPNAKVIAEASTSVERRAAQAPLKLQPSVESRERQQAELQAGYVLQRRERIQRVLLALDSVASATLQMKPETAARLEPVVVDLAEQAIDLSRDEAIRAPETDESLGKLEATVSQLIRTMNKMVEPEMSL